MNSIALNKFIEKEKFKGSANTNIYLSELYQRTSVAFSTIILSMLALSISSKKRRGGIGINLAIGISIAFVYIFINESARIFTSKDVLDPLTSSWFGNIIFGVITLFIYLKRANF
jgi:lipopolysaccharide export system permease protein